MNIGHSLQTKYYMGEGPGRKELESVHQERDLGVITHQISNLPDSVQNLQQQQGK